MSIATENGRWMTHTEISDLRKLVATLAQRASAQTVAAPFRKVEATDADTLMDDLITSSAFATPTDKVAVSLPARLIKAATEDGIDVASICEAAVMAAITADSCETPAIGGYLRSLLSPEVLNMLLTIERSTPQHDVDCQTRVAKNGWQVTRRPNPVSQCVPSEPRRCDRCREFKAESEFESKRRHICLDCQAILGRRFTRPKNATPAYSGKMTFDDLQSFLSQTSLDRS